ncbi:MAG: hypothetical protein NDJ92_16205 [Thermoanaerobaculia bacterium]|nr:hypothetical protein [Thermoanaerobaculia bacterium]
MTKRTTPTNPDQARPTPHSAQSAMREQAPVVPVPPQDAPTTLRRFALCVECGEPVESVTFPADTSAEPDTSGLFCPTCDTRLEAVEHALPPNTQRSFPLGPNGGVLIRRRVPGSDDWVTSEYFPPDDDRDHFHLVAPEVSFDEAAIVLRMTRKTLYSKAAFLASAKKVGGRWVFSTDLLYESDLEEMPNVPTREETLAARKRRAAKLGTLRPGRHAVGCAKDHAGPCRTHASAAGFRSFCARARGSTIQK